MANGHVEIWGRAALSVIPGWGGAVEILYSGYRDRAAQRGMEFLGPLAAQFQDPEALNVALAASDPLAAVFDRALRTALESGLADKRIALGKVVSSALEDAAVVDHASLLVDTLAQVEAPHVRAMVEVRKAVDEVKAAGEWPSRARGAEHEILSHVTNIGNQQPDTVIRTLKALGLIYAAESTDDWFVHDLTPYGYELLSYLVAEVPVTESAVSPSDDAFGP